MAGLEVPAEMSFGAVTTRLSTVAVDLDEQLRGLSAQALREVAAGVAAFAVARVSLADPRLDAAMASIEKGTPGNSTELSDMRSLVAELDEKAWDKQDRVERGLLPPQAYREAFTWARAAAAVAFALEPDALSAALESVYEAWAASTDIDGVRIAVQGALEGT
jgi:hypothetical protein